jgi:putative ABC transport system permease protein
MPDEVPRDLLERFVHGDDQAFESLFRLFEREVYRWILRIVHGDARATDRDAGGGAAGTGRGGWRDADGREWCDTDHADTMTDLRLAARRLLATPLFTVFAVLSLAIGVAVTTAVYSVVDSIFLRDAGARDPDRVVIVVSPYDGLIVNGSISLPDFQDLRAAQTSFTSISASASFTPAVASSFTTELLAAEAVDGAYFSTLGVSPAMGRTIQPADDAGAARVVVLSHALWRRRFAANPAVVGQSIRISGQPFEVVGVAAASFAGVNGPLPGTRLWIPLAAEASLSRLAPTVPMSPRDRRRLVVFGRLAPPVTAAAASAELSAIAATLDTSFPPRTPSGQPRATERPWKGKTMAAVSGEDTLAFRRFGRTIVALVALVLAVACTNLANLVLARGAGRQHEIAVRRALGASRGRLVREQCAESLLLATAGGLAAYVVFQGLCVLMDVEFNLVLPGGGRWILAIRPAPETTALWIATGSLLVSLVVFGLEPALQLTRSRDLRGELAAGVGVLGAPKTRRQRTLLRWQVAISAGFFIVATMFVKYTIAEARHDPGIDLKRLGVAVLNFRTQQWDEARVRRTVDRVVEEARKDQAIEAVSVSTGMPLGLPAMRLTLSQPETAIGGTPDRYNAVGVAATPSLFKTIGVPILRGRGFDDRDDAAAAPVVVLSEFTARRIFGTSDAVGRPVVVQGHFRVTATVIGVARDTDVGYVFGESHPVVYLPLAQGYEPFLAIVVRSTGDVAMAVRALRGALRQVDPDLAVEVIGTGRTVLAGVSVFLRAAGVAALALGGLTLALAMVGLFGIQSHTVAHRTREIGVRISLGASPSQIQRMVMRDGYRPVVEGLALGLFIGVIGRVIVRAYTDLAVSVVDPWLFFVVPIPLIVAAFCACYFPAHRAAGVDPNVALRHL